MTTELAIANCLSKWRDYSGRAIRSEFWQFYLFVLALQMCLGAADNWLFNTLGIPFPILSLLAVALTYPPLTAVVVRRLHDIGLNGWFLVGAFMLAAAFVSARHFLGMRGFDAALMVLSVYLALLLTLALPTQNRTNKFGLNPHEVTP